MRRVLTLVLAPAALCLTPFLAPAQTVAAHTGPVAELTQRLQGPTPLLDDLEHLTDAIGGRPTGSPALDRATSWALARLRSAGLENVHSESYTIPLAWVPGIELGFIMKPALADGGASPLPIHIAAMPYGPPTPPAGTTAEVTDVGAGDDAGFAAAGERVTGRWVLVHSEPMASIEQLFQEYLETPPLVTRATRGGAAGILFMSSRPRGLLYRHNLTLDGTLAPLPGAILAREDAERIARLLARGEIVSIRIVSRPRLVRDATARNVVAEIRGEGDEARVVLLGAHLDSWDLGTGAQDNGCNVALVIDVARQMMALVREGHRPRRTVRFVLYSGEELGLLGSLADVRAHRETLDSVAAQMTIDEGSGAITGFSLGGRKDLEEAVAAALAPVTSLGPFEQSVDAFVGTDNYDYLVEGIPTLVANQVPAPYLPDYHATSDTFDKVDQVTLKRNAAITGAVTWGLAAADRPPAPRLTRTQVEALVRASGLEAQMKVFGLWQGFGDGSRGRQRP